MLQATYWMFQFLKNGRKVMEMVKTNTIPLLKKNGKKRDLSIFRKGKRNKELRMKRMEILEVLDAKGAELIM